MLDIKGPPRRPEIDQNVIKLLIGLGAFSLPIIELVVSWVRGQPLESISASYLYDPWPRNIFVGFLFGIGAFMLSYNGEGEEEMWLAKFGAVAAFCLALFPCHCTDGKHEIVPHVHLIATIVMFGVLTRFCFIFASGAHSTLDQDPTNRQARARKIIYYACVGGMVLSIALFLTFVVWNWPPAKALGGAAAPPQGAMLVLVAEILGLLSFGISWVTASHVSKWVTKPGETTDVFVWQPKREGDKASASSSA